MVPKRALNSAGITPQIAPAKTALHTATTVTQAGGNTSASFNIHAALAIPAIRTCPSAPVFQNRILNAGVTAKEIHSKTAVLCSSVQILRGVPNEPSNIVRYTSIGFCPVKSSVTTPQNTNAAKTANMRMSHALHHGIAGRLTICINGSCCFLICRVILPHSLPCALSAPLPAWPQPSVRRFVLLSPFWHPKALLFCQNQ